MAPSRHDEFRTVYSTDHGKLCPTCGKSAAQCNGHRKSKAANRPTAPPPKNDGVVRVGRETKGRKGKGVTLITGVALAAAELDKLAKQLKQKCGAGGAVKHGVIEIQGDHRDMLVAELSKQGYTVKRSGG